MSCPFCNKDESCPGRHHFIDAVNMTDEELATEGLIRIAKTTELSSLVEMAKDRDAAIDEVERIMEEAQWAASTMMLFREQRDAARKVVNAALRLRSSGYDGPWIGKVCEDLYSALADYEKDVGM